MSDQKETVAMSQESGITSALVGQAVVFLGFIWGIFKSISLYMRHTAEKTLQEKEARAATFLAFGERQLIELRSELDETREENKKLYCKLTDSEKRYAILEIECKAIHDKLRWTESDKDKFKSSLEGRDKRFYEMIGRLEALETSNQELIHAASNLAASTDRTTKLLTVGVENGKSDSSGT